MAFRRLELLMNGRFYLDRDGCRLAYRREGDGPPVLLVQGVGAHGDAWAPQMEALTASFEFLSFDNRGMGESQPLAGALTVERMADDALALLDAAGWESAHVVGHSLGGLIALRLALAARERVRSLSLLCTFARGRDCAPMTVRMLWLGLRSRVGTRRQRRRGFLGLVMPPAALLAEDGDALAERLAPLFGHDLSDQPPVVSKQLAAMRAYDPGAALAGLAGIPTLVVACEHDPIAPPSAGRTLAATIPGAHYVELDGASHGVTLHQPDRVNALLRKHLSGLEAERPGGMRLER
jgi:pimeloyl-ACP methyl ester carboxylesterase